VCSTDGYCTIASFADGELGKVFTGDCTAASAAPKTDNDAEVIELFNTDIYFASNGTS